MTDLSHQKENFKSYLKVFIFVFRVYRGYLSSKELFYEEATVVVNDKNKIEVTQTRLLT